MSACEWRSFPEVRGLSANGVSPVFSRAVRERVDQEESAKGERGGEDTIKKSAGDGK